MTPSFLQLIHDLRDQCKGGGVQSFISGLGSAFIGLSLLVGRVFHHPIAAFAAGYILVIAFEDLLVRLAGQKLGGGPQENIPKTMEEPDLLEGHVTSIDISEPLELKQARGSSQPWAARFSQLIGLLLVLSLVIGMSSFIGSERAYRALAMAFCAFIVALRYRPTWIEFVGFPVIAVLLAASPYDHLQQVGFVFVASGLLTAIRGAVKQLARGDH